MDGCLWIFSLECNLYQSRFIAERERKSVTATEEWRKSEQPRLGGRASCRRSQKGTKKNKNRNRWIYHFLPCHFHPGLVEVFGSCRGLVGVLLAWVLSCHFHFHFHLYTHHSLVPVTHVSHFLFTHTSLTPCSFSISFPPLTSPAFPFPIPVVFSFIYLSTMRC
jgi:hypothetical protein